MNVGRRVWGWEWPIVWWARRKPRSLFRQWVWRQADAVQWRLVCRAVRKRTR